ncbi:hypothetical protein EI77_01132 [Prosthecobacter fusiformis]|uniref:Uncharacterized protein n=1 Tax=Prosthecobacter fusiformis TaxID=48464 RepID=A0A4R7SRE4_9BACT|nr:hypothetical protein [Prosthecobacter fusiformis]TDU81822.1 hypothetical protein EI77_01132 [Prosthecobacter fusiformis]
MRNHRQQAPADSFDLLLDTLCNVFGSIILIACLLALVTREPEPTPVSPVADVHGKGLLLERRIEAAREEKARLEMLLEELKIQDNRGLRLLVAERDELRATVERLRLDQDERTRQERQRGQAASVDPGRELATLRQQSIAEAARLADIQSQLQAAQLKADHVTERLQRLTRQADASENQNIEQLRMPREKPKTKDPRPVILRYGEVFPLTDAEGKATPSVRRAHEADEGFIAHPKKTEGLLVRRDWEQLKQLFLHHKQTGGYLTIYIYPDSFATFREIKQLIIETGIEYGLESYGEFDAIKFSKEGAAPSPL